jgi:hypothetical protein
MLRDKGVRKATMIGDSSYFAIPSTHRPIKACGCKKGYLG